jgi:uncharacterized protein YcnI
MKKAVILACTTVVAAVVASVASAHVEPTQSTAPAGGYPVIGFNVPHGCDGSSTRQVTIQIPAGVSYVKPRPIAGWRVTIVRGTLPQPVKDFAGNTQTKGVVAVRWTGGPLADTMFQTFDLMLGLPNTPGKTLYFKTVQRCVKGVTRWIEIPKAGQAEPEHPAPAVKLVKSSGGHG